MARMLAGGKGDDRGWDGWMASPNHGYEFKQAPGDGEGQGSLVGYSLWGHKESDTTERLNNSKALIDAEIKDVKTQFSLKDFAILRQYPIWSTFQALLPGVLTLSFPLRTSHDSTTTFLRSLHTTSTLLNKCSLSFPGLTFNLDSAWSGEVSELHECFKDYQPQDFGDLQMFSV